MSAPAAKDRQVGGSHYKDMGFFQPIEVLKVWLTPEEYRGWIKGTSIAYLARERQKGGDVDVRKAHHILEFLLEELDALAAAAEKVAPSPTVADGSVSTVRSAGVSPSASTNGSSLNADDCTGYLLREIRNEIACLSLASRSRATTDADFRREAHNRLLMVTGFLNKLEA